MIKRYYTIDEAITYLSVINRHPINNRDFFHLVSERKLRLCFVHLGSLAICDADSEWVAKITGFLEFNGYMEVPLTHLKGIESAILYPLEGNLIFCGSFDGFCIPLEQFDKSKIPDGSYFFCHSLMRFERNKYIGMDWMDASIKYRSDHSNVNEFPGPDVYFHDALIPTVDIDNLLKGITAHQADSKQMEAEYTTHLLEIQARAIERYWGPAYDPKDPHTANDSATIVDWLKEQGCSDRAAKAIDLIIRPEESKKGGAKPRT